MALHQAQVEIARCNKRFIVVNAGRRFGKSYLCSEELIASAIIQKGRRCLYISPTYQSSRDIMWSILKERCKPIIVKANESLLTMEVQAQGGGTSLIMLRGWEAVDTIRGQWFNTIIIDEVSSMKKFWAGWQEVLLPTLADKQGNSIMISTPKGKNHFYELYNTHITNPDTWASFHYTTYDNPHIKEEEIDMLKTTMSHERFLQEFMGEWVVRQDLVYKEFVDSMVTSEQNIPHDYKLLGIDWGYTNATGALLIYVRNGKFYVMKEYYQTKKTTDEIIEAIAQWKADYTYADPAEPDRIEQLRRANFYVRDVSKEVIAQVDKVRELFVTGRLVIHSSCVNLIAELHEYHYDENAPEHLRDKPVKESDHLINALQYALHTYTATELSAYDAFMQNQSFSRHEAQEIHNFN